MRIMMATTKMKKLLFFFKFNKLIFNNLQICTYLIHNYVIEK